VTAPSATLSASEASSRVDVALAETLRAFADRLFGSGEGTAEILVAVSRQDRFTNLAAAGGMALRLDEPVDFGGAGLAFDPAEALLAAVGASLSVTVTAHAALRSLAIADIRISLAAKIDGPSFFQPRDHPRTGLRDTEIEVLIVSDEATRDLRALFAEARRACPVLQSLKRRPKIALILQRADAPPC
jgi:uncharacterized OsmC-like protein